MNLGVPLGEIEKLGYLGEILENIRHFRPIFEKVKPFGGGGYKCFKRLGMHEI